MSASHSLELFVQCLKKVRRPRSKQGTSQPFRTILTIIFLGLIARLSTFAEIERWIKIHATHLQQFLRFRKKGIPSDNTLSRVLENSRSVTCKPPSPRFLTPSSVTLL